MSRARITFYLLLAACLAVLTACVDPGDVTSQQTDAVNASTGKAVLQADRSFARTGEPVVLDASGSSIADQATADRLNGGKPICPQAVTFFYDDEANIARFAATKLTDVRTLVTDGVCRVVGASARAPMPTGRDAARFSVVVEAALVRPDGTPVLVASSADVSVKRGQAAAPAAPPSASPAAPATTTTATAPTTVPTTTAETAPTTPSTTPTETAPTTPSTTPTETAPTTPSTTPTTPATTPTTPSTTPTTPTPPDGPITCGSSTAAPDGQDPQPYFVVNPSTPVAGSPLQVDATESSDPDGTIVRYRWSFSGGTVDATGTTASTTPSAAGTVPVCLEVVDDRGNVATATETVTVQPAGAFAARAPAVSQTGATVTVTPAGGTGAAYAQVFWGDGSQSYVGAPGAQTVSHTYAEAGRKRIETLYGQGDSSVTSTWTSYVTVASARPAFSLRATVGTGRPAARGVVVRTRLSEAGVRIRRVASLGFRGGDLTFRGGIVTLRTRGSAPRAALRRLPGLRAFTSADVAMRIDGKRLLATPTLGYLQGSATILARARGDRRTSVCLSMRADASAPLGSRWRVLGGTGAARRLTGSGTYARVHFGPLTSPAPRGTATLRTGRAGSMARCRGLASYLPKRR